jgi:archaeal cell division control protein 6
MNKLDLKRIALEVETENYFFSDKSNLDSLRSPSKIVGRQDKGKDIARFLLGYKKGHVVPFISVYGRSGSGKSSTVKFVLENLDSENISYKFVNLREARTVFGCANLILSELGKEPLKSAQGINVAVDHIGKEIESILELRKRKAWPQAVCTSA